MMNKLAFALLGTLAVPATAQDAPMAMPQAAPVCPRDAEPIPRALAAWADRKPLMAATDQASLGRPRWRPALRSISRSPPRRR